MEILRDSIWQFVGAIVAILSVVATVWIYLLQKNRKSFSYLILASNELLTASEEIRGRVKILFDKKTVQNVHLLVVKFTNNGNVPILSSDFYEPIKIYFGEETKILSADVVEHSPETFDPATIIEDNSLSMVPTLINSRDSFTIKFLLAQYTEGEMKISGRIIGIKAVTLDTGKIFWQRRWKDLIIVVLFILLLYVMLTSSQAPVSWDLVFSVIIITVFIYSVINGVIDAFRYIAFKFNKN